MDFQERKFEGWGNLDVIWSSVTYTGRGETNNTAE